MAWLAVDYYGDEYIFEDKPKKMGHRKCDDFNIYFEEIFDSNGKPVGVRGIDVEPVENKIIPATFDDLTHYDYDGCCIELPKGTIEKLIGKTLTWKDAPVELDDCL